MDHLDHVAPGEDAGLQHPQVGTHPRVLGEPAYPRGVVVAATTHPRLEVVARGPDGRELEEHGADPPALTDLGVVDGDALRGEVLAELAVAELVPELPRPPVQLLAGEGEARLARPAVVPSVGGLVADEAEPLHLDRAAHRRLVDRGPPDAGPGSLARHPHVHRPQHALTHPSMIGVPPRPIQRIALIRSCFTRGTRPIQRNCAEPVSPGPPCRSRCTW